MPDPFTDYLAEQERRKKAALIAAIFASEGMEGLVKRGLAPPGVAPFSEGGQGVSIGEAARNLNRPWVTPEQVEQLPGWLQPIGRAGRELTSPTQAALLLATAGLGPTIGPAIGGAATAIRGTTPGLAGFLRAIGALPVRAAAGMATPIAKGPFAQRLAAEAVVGTGATLVGQELAQRIPETAPLPVRVGAPLLAGVAGGVGMVAGGRAAMAAGRAATKAGERYVGRAIESGAVSAGIPGPKPRVTMARVAPEGGEARGQAEMPVTPSAPPVVKEPWEMLRRDFVNAGLDVAPKREGRFVDPSIRSKLAAQHKNFVEQALSEGKPVPPGVKGDYPDLAAKVPPPAAAPAPGLPIPGPEIAEMRMRVSPEEIVADMKRGLAEGRYHPDREAFVRRMIAESEQQIAPERPIPDIGGATEAAAEPIRAAAEAQAVQPTAADVVPPPASAAPIRPVIDPAEALRQAEAARIAAARAARQQAAPQVTQAPVPAPTGSPPPVSPAPTPPPPGGAFPSGRRAGGYRGVPPTPVDNYQRLKDALEPPHPSLKAQKSRARDALLRHIYDRNYVLGRLESVSGIPSHKLAQLVPGATAAGEDILRTNVRPLWEPLGKDVRHLEQYMVLMRNSDILARNPAARLPGRIQNIGGNMQALTILKQRLGVDRFKAVEDAANRLWQANDDLNLKPMLREGLIDNETYAAMKSAYPHYIPFHRNDFADIFDQTLAGARSEASVSSTGIQRMDIEGSERVLDNPLARFEAQFIKTQSVIFRNRAAKSVAQALEVIQAATGEDVIRFIEPRRELLQRIKVTGQQLPVKKVAEHSQLWDTVSYFENGTKHTVEIPRMYAEVAKGLGNEPDNILLTIGRALAQPLRMGATTLSPAFAIINPIFRDLPTAFFREGLTPFSRHYWAGWAAAINRNALFSQAARSGALMSGIVDEMKSIKAMSKRQRLGSLSIRNPGDAVLLLPRLLIRANEISETSTRLATFSKLKAEGLSDLEAAVRARDVTVDFRKAGTTIRVLNQVVPFVNASIQGAVNVGRTIKSNPTRALAILAIPMTVTVLSRINNMRFEETSPMIPDYEFRNNWVFQIAEGTHRDGTKFPIIFKIPKPPVIALPSIPMEALFTLASKTNDKSAAAIVLSAAGQTLEGLSPVEPSTIGLFPPLAGTAVSDVANYDFFRGQAIVPQKEEGLLPEQQFGEETSKVAIALGQATGISPRLIDFAIKDSSAGAGEASTWLIDLGLEALRYEPEVYGSALKPKTEQPTAIETFSQKPVVRRFLGTKSNQLERQEWDAFNAMTEATQRNINSIPEMNGLGIKLSAVGNTFDATPGIPNDSIELTPGQRAYYQRLVGEEAYTQIRKNMANPAWATASPERKKKSTQYVIDKAREDVRERLREAGWPGKVTSPASTSIDANEEWRRRFIAAGATSSQPQGTYY